MIVVIATLRAKPGKEQEMLDALKALIPPTRQEEGCIQYELHVRADDPAVFAFYERWTSREALDSHIQTPHVQAAFARLPELSGESVTITMYSLVE